MSNLTPEREELIRARLNRCYEAAARNDPPAYAEAWMDMDANAKPDLEDLLTELDRLRGQLADAWDEGYVASGNDILRDEFGYSPTNEPRPNPYRKGTES